MQSGERLGLMSEWTATPTIRVTHQDFPQAVPLGPISIDAIPDVLAAYKSLPYILVLGLPRASTKAAFHFFYKNFSDRAKVAHTHGLSPRFERELADLGDAKKIVALERVRKLFKGAKRTLIVIPLRAPVSRIYSYYLYFNRDRIGSFFDENTHTFADQAAIQADFDRFALEEAVRECLWYGEELKDPFGLDLEDLPVATLDAPAVLEHGGRDFLFARSETLSETINALANRVSGWNGTRLKRRNGVEELGLTDIARVFRKTFQFPASATSQLGQSGVVRRLYSYPTPL